MYPVKGAEVITVANSRNKEENKVPFWGKGLVPGYSVTK